MFDTRVASLFESSSVILVKLFASLVVAQAGEVLGVRGLVKVII